jgi:CheY-like chemotaxis protein
MRTPDVCPQTQQPPLALTGPSGRTEITMRPKKTILCVDDNEQALSVRKFMLETRGYRVLTALNGQQALELFQPGGIDLVLSDLVMPLMDGNELVHRMKAMHPDVPMILMSGCVKAYERASHADAFLPKGSCSPVEVLERIRLMVARKRGPKKTVVVNHADPEISADGFAIFAS